MGVLTRPGRRLGPLVNWLQADVWSAERFQNLQTEKYLSDGEKMVKQAEEVALSAAYGIYDEFTAESQSRKSLLDEYSKDVPTTVVVLDGVSIREIPLLLKHAQETGFKVLESSYSLAAVPSETQSFVEQRVIGKRLAPSQLPGRRELTALNVSAYYYDTPIRSFELPDDGRSFLLWSAFPDGTYTDFEARNAAHFEAIVRQFDVVWKNVILAIPAGHRIIITSDHGYVYFGVGLESDRNGEEALRWLDQDRAKFWEEGAAGSPDCPELQVVPGKRLAMLRGRIKNRPQGKSANKVFRHGGMSFMEMLTPWLVIQK